MSDTAIATTTEITETDNNTEPNIPFKGTYDKLISNWYNIIDVKNYENRQVNYLEIGSSYGANIILFAYTYGKHQHSKLYCIDPYKDYITNLDKEGSKLSIGNLGYLVKVNSSYQWVSHFNTTDYYKDITISPIEENEQAKNNLSIKWYWVAIVFALIAMAAILFKSL